MSKIASNLTKISYEDKILEAYEKQFQEEFAKETNEDKNLFASLVNR